MPRARLRASLLIAGAGAVTALIGVLDTLGAAIGLALMLAGTLLSAGLAPDRAGGEPNWWGLLALGVAVALVGVPLELASETAGGLLTAVGATLVVVGVALGLP